MVEDPFSELREDRAGEDEEIVRIGSAPSLAHVLQWLADYDVTATPAPDGQIYFSGAELRVDEERTSNPLGKHGGRRLIHAINAGRASSPGPHTTSYVVRSLDYDLGEFDWSSEQVHVVMGEWFPHLEPMLAEGLGGGITQYWNRWEHHFVLDGELVVATYWFNEFGYGGGQNRKLLLDDHHDVDLVLTGPEHVLAASRPVLANLADRCRSEAEQVPIAVAHSSSDHPPMEAWQTAAEILTGESRPWSSIWPLIENPISEQELAEAEAARGLRLPALMRQMLLERNGGRMRGFFDEDNWVNQHDSDIRPFGGLNLFPWFYDWQMTPDVWKPTRPLSLLVAFTGDGHADVCLDYRKRGPNREPQITLVDNERQEIRLITESFPAYVAMLFDEQVKIPAAPGVTLQDLGRQLVADIAGAAVQEIYGEQLEVSKGDQRLCQLRNNKHLPEYAHCENIVMPFATEHVEDLVRSLHGAGLLEGSMPKQSWDPTS